ncbi:MAG: hypothetical protein AAF726_20470 [Planctomycetota bacterium]
MHPGRLLLPVALAIAALTGGARAQTCLTTLYASDNGGTAGGAIFFDVVASEQIRITSLETSILEPPGTPRFEIYAISTSTLASFPTRADAWRLVATDDGQCVWGGLDQPTRIGLSQPIDLYRGTWGLAIVAVDGRHRYTNADGSNQNHGDGTIEIQCGTAQNDPFGAQMFLDRVWNGTLCYEPLIGVVSTIAQPQFDWTQNTIHLFEVVTDRPIAVRKLHAWLGADAGRSFTVDLWSIDGSYDGHEPTSHDWTPHGTIFGLTTETAYSPTPIPLPEPILLPAGRSAFRVRVSGINSIRTRHEDPNDGPYTDGYVTLERGATFANGSLSPGQTQCMALDYEEVPATLNTILAANNGGLPGGAVFFDLRAAAPISIDGFDLNLDRPGEPVEIDVHVTAGSRTGNLSAPGAWQRRAVDDGSTTSRGLDERTRFDLEERLELPAGSYGVAIVVRGAAHQYTNGTASNRSFSDGTVTLELGEASSTPFHGGVIPDRIWNGSVRYFPTFEIGTRYCSPAVVNSTGAPATLRAYGKTWAFLNEVTLTAEGLPPGSFGFFLASRSETLVPGAGGSQGTLCLGGSIGRYAGDVFAAGPIGAGALRIDLASMPSPHGTTSVIAGRIWRFQAWYRDANPGLTSNFTDAVAIRFD